MKETMAPLSTVILIVCGLVLAILSATDLCSFSGCTEAHQYNFWGISLPAVGVAYFSLLATALIASFRFTAAGAAVSPLLAGGAGAEITMIHLQKNVIHAWCPLCLGIALVVCLLCILQFRRFIIASRRAPAMNRPKFISRLLLFTAAAATGFLVSFTGITSPDAAAPQIDISLGKPGSKIEVYVFSDWLCPVCVKVEPALEAAFPTMEKRAKIYFLDKPVHREAMNFVPYHLSFLVNEKPKYLQIRRALFALAKKTKSPTLDDIRDAVAPQGVTYRQLSFMDVTQLMGKSQSLATQYKVNATPTVVIVNTVTRKSKTLIGGSDITQENLLKALKTVE